ncbi:MAG: undecaprenyl-diphosphatase [Pseudomonadales bacterium]|jgi:undecaprenyl-diphosphatase
MEILSKLQKIDASLLGYIYKQSRRRTVVPVAKAISRSGDGYLHALIPLLLLLMAAPQANGFFVLLAGALLIERILYWLLKNGLKRRRPQDFFPDFSSIITASDRFSFPSGHTSGAFLLATALAVVYASPFIVVYAWACLVGLSRVVLGVHFPGDTLVGALMGSGCCLLVANFMELI